MGGLKACLVVKLTHAQGKRQHLEKYNSTKIHFVREVLQ